MDWKWLQRGLSGLFAAVTLLAGPVVPVAEAVTFSVNPTQVFLSARTRSGLLTLRNESTEELRFQLTVFAWTQTPAGEMQLEPTSDIIFFPALLTLRPREERQIRIGAATASASLEKTYRIFIEELPPAAGKSQDPGAVHVLTKMGIPIFLRPPAETASAVLSGLTERAGTFTFSLSNTGTVHFVPSRVAVRGLGSDGNPIFDRELPSWYILSAGRRDFALTVGADECDRVTALVVDVELSSTTLTERLDVPAGACRQ